MIICACFCGQNVSATSGNNGGKIATSGNKGGKSAKSGNKGGKSAKSGYNGSKSATSGDNGGNAEGGDTNSDSDNSIHDVSKGECTSILPGNWCESEDGINSVISMVVAILTGAVVVAGTIGIIICGFLWMTARENEAQVVMAKKRMLDIVIGIVAWVLLALLANLFIPKSSTDIKTDTPGLSVVNNKDLTV